MFEHLLQNFKHIVSFNNHQTNSNFEDDDQTNENITSKSKNFLNVLKFNFINLKNESNNNDEDYKISMLPRVNSNPLDNGQDNDRNKYCWSPVDLAPSETLTENLNNVLDKFVRVIQFNGSDHYKTRQNYNYRRNDREEIRRRLAMGDEDDYFRNGGMPNSHEKPTRKPSLQSRLKNGMNLQICFMNDPVSDDNESPSSDSETCPKLSKVNTANYQKYTSSSSGGGTNPYNSRPLSVSLKQQQNKLANGNNSPNYHSNGATKKIPATRPMSLSLGPPIVAVDGEISSDFFTKQAKLQIEARMALSQAKDMAHMQMEIERQKQKQSPITEVIRNSLEKVGVHFPPEKRRVSRQMLTDMNIAQLQVIVNELHTQIEFLNEKLVQYLMERDELHMSQDSMLVDIEDLTRYLGAKEQPNIETAESRKNSTLSMSSSTSSTSINNKNHLKLTIPKSSSNHLKSSSSSSSDNSPQNLTKSSSQNSITSTSSHSQILQNRFLRIASLVKK